MTAVADGSGLNEAVADGSGLNEAVAGGSGLNEAVAGGSGLNQAVADGSGLNEAVADGSGLNEAVSGPLPIAVHAEPHFQFFELFDVPLGCGVDVLGFGDEPHVVAARDAAIVEDLFVRPQVLAVDDEQLVLIELDLLRKAGIEHRDAGAAVVHEQIFEIPQRALQDRHVDVFAVEIGVALGFLAVTGFKDDVDHFAQTLRSGT